MSLTLSTEIAKNPLVEERGSVFNHVLGLSGVELIFFISPHTVLCPAFVTAVTVLVTHLCFSCC